MFRATKVTANQYPQDHLQPSRLPHQAPKENNGCHTSQIALSWLIPLWPQKEGKQILLSASTTAAQCHPLPQIETTHLYNLTLSKVQANKFVSIIYLNPEPQ